MYSVLKRMAAFCIVFAIINAFCTLMSCMLGLGYLSEDIGLVYGLIGMFGTASLLFILIGMALWNLHGDLEANNENNAEDVAELKKRIKELESKLELMEKK